MDITTEAVRVGLDIAQLRAQIASSNIANADVPNSKVRRADFADALRALSNAAERPDGSAAAQLADITPESLQEDVQSSVSTASTVALDDEVAQLNADSVTYRVLSEGLARRFALMQLAISGK